jgi:hypothetical protein
MGGMGGLKAIKHSAEREDATVPKMMTDEQMDQVTAAGGGQHLIITSSGGNGGVVHENCTGTSGPECAGPIFPFALSGNTVCNKAHPC